MINRNNSYIAVSLGILLVLIVAGMIIATGPTAAQQGIDVSVDAPDEITAGDQATIAASVTTPDIGVRDHEAELAVDLNIDGETVASETVTVGDGETTEVAFAHTFERTGSVAVEIQGEGAIAGQTLSSSASTTVNVQAPEPDTDFGIEVNVPNEVEAGQEAEIATAATAPSFPTSETGEATVTVYVDGEQVYSETELLEDGQTMDVSTGQTFDSAGSATVEVVAEATLAGQTFSDSISRTVNVPVGVETTTVEGASFTVPESLDDEVEDLRGTLPDDVGAYAFVVATEDNLYLVFTGAEPVKGEASVEGITPGQSVSHGDLEFEAIAASDVSFNQDGEQTTVEAVANNPDEYRLDLVQVDATHRSLAIRTKPPDTDFSYATTTGILVENPQDPVDIFSDIRERGQQAIVEEQTDVIEDTVAELNQPSLFTGSFERDFWVDEERTVDGIVLNPRSQARAFVEQFDQESVQHVDAEDPLLYRVQDDFNPQEYDDVGTLTRQADDGDVVSVNARLFQQTVSVQESIKEAAPSCDEGESEDWIMVESSCVFLLHDVVLHGGAAWNDIPQDRDDVLLVMGASSWEQDQPITERNGRYDITGQIISTERVDESLPGGQILLVYDLEQTSEIEFEAVADEAQELIEERTDELVTELESQTEMSDGDTDTESIQTSAETIAAGETASLTFANSDRERVGIEEIRLAATTEIESISFSASEVSELPATVEDPPSEPATLLNITTSASNDAIDQATIELAIDQADVTGESDLVVYRYHDAEWNVLDVTVGARTESEIILEVETTGFSYFAVAEEGSTEDSDDGTSNSDTDQDDNTANADTDGEQDSTGENNADDDGPGFTFIGGLIALLIVSLHAKRR